MGLSFTSVEPTALAVCAKVAVLAKIKLLLILPFKIELY
jgi:hypothetical protein